jgi:hypothetical protein
MMIMGEGFSPCHQIPPIFQQIIEGNERMRGRKNSRCAALAASFINSEALCLLLSRNSRANFVPWDLMTKLKLSSISHYVFSIFPTTLVTADCQNQTTAAEGTHFSFNLFQIFCPTPFNLHAPYLRQKYIKD